MAIGRQTVYRGLHVKAEFELNRSGIRDIALNTELRAAVHEIAENHAKPIAELLAADFSDTGTYARSFHVEDTTEVAGPPQFRMRRAAARLVNDATHPGQKESYALVVEVGDARFEGHHVLTRTLDQLVALGIVTMRNRKLRRRA